MSLQPATPSFWVGTPGLPFPRHFKAVVGLSELRDELIFRGLNEYQAEVLASAAADGQVLTPNQIPVKARS